MDNTQHEFTLTSRAKLVMLTILLVFGAPILYAAWLQFQYQKPLMAALMVGLFILFVLVLVIATGYKVKIGDATLQRESLLNSTSLDFEDIEVIHFGNSWTNFHVQSNSTKIFITEDFEDHEHIIRHIIDKVKSYRQLENINLTGNTERMEHYR